MTSTEMTHGEICRCFQRQEIPKYQQWVHLKQAMPQQWCRHEGEFKKDKGSFKCEGKTFSMSWKGSVWSLIQQMKLLNAALWRLGQRLNWFGFYSACLTFQAGLSPLSRTSPAWRMTFWGPFWRYPPYPGISEIVQIIWSQFLSA